MTIVAELTSTINKLATKGKGILAADESTPTITKRFQAVGIESSEETRRTYREILMTTPGCNQYVAGVILFEETLNQKTNQGVPFPETLKNLGILPGIKVDKGLVHLANTTDEQITQGLDGLPERLAEYKSKGACFAKWRAVYAISNNTPSKLAIKTNAEVLARYAAICQEQGIVPIVEPEILIDGDHTITHCEEVSEPVLHAVFNALYRHKVKLEYIVLKPSMIINGKACSQKASVNEVAEATVRVLRRTVPGAVPTINFLSGGQTPEQSTAHLNAMNQLGYLPWNLSFSYARALQDYCMKTWAGQAKNISAAQAAFYKRAKLNSLAAMGKYTELMEKEEVSHA
ncbi:MAG: fructose-bisphosphate aldolase class I [Gammaproteobacteria bacterium]|nr:fructose-bisphosphate aldolase class I [Gammaproteobacteria bacterium]MCW5584067.1 fructose-bisphosphate aldolase class I [Gammaproteobacteria bacterium]